MAAARRRNIERENRAIAGAYYGEAFARKKRLEKLTSYLIDPDGRPKGETIQTPDDMLAALKAIQAGGAQMNFKFIPNKPEGNT